MVVGLMRTVDRTADEAWYINAGRSILTSGWEFPPTQVHGPVPFLATQLLVGDFPPGGVTVQDIPRDLLFRARLGMLPFFLLAGAVVFLWTRAAFGLRGAALAAVAFALHPLLLGYAGLAAVDMSHTAATLLVLFCAWSFVQRRSAPRATVLGASLGLGLATKFLILFQIPVVAGVVVLATRADPRPWRSALRSLLLVAACAVIALHACYGFRAGTALGLAPELHSDLLHSLLRRPVVGWLAALLPRPFLQGCDFQLSITPSGPPPYLLGRFAPIHPTYYLWVFLVRTPEWILLLFLVALPCLWRRARAGSRAERSAIWILVAGIALPLLYLSLLAPVQRGPRYALPQVALACVLLGVLGRRAGTRPFLGALLPALVLLLGWHLVELTRQWPDLLSYFNPTSGGPVAARRWFCDTNEDWWQHRRDGERLLREEWGPDLVLLPPVGGPRFGFLAASLECLCRPDRLDPGRSRSWLDPFRAEGALGASFWVFRVDAPAFERAARETGTPRVHADLALAYAGAGELERARASLALAKGDTRTDAIAAVIEKEEGGPPVSWEDARDRARAWLTLHREDLALRLAETYGVDTDPRLLELRVEIALFQTNVGSALAAADRWSGPVNARTNLLLSVAAREAAEPDRAILFLKACIEDLHRRGGDASHQEKALHELEEQIAEVRAFQRSLR